MNITNADIAAVKEYQAALEELTRKYCIAVNGLTEKQLAEAILQAIDCGDFQKQVCVANSSQAVIYIPFAEQARLQARIRELEEQLKNGPRECGHSCYYCDEN